MQKTLKTSAFSGLVWKFTERMSTQFVSLVVSILLARLLMPEDYSVISIVTIFFSFCDVLITGGFSTALVQKKNADELDYSVVYVITSVMSLVFYIIMFFSAPYIAQLYENEILVPVMRIMGLIMFIKPLTSVLNAYVSKELMFKDLFIRTLLSTVLSAVIGIVMALKGFGPWALVAQQMSNRLIGTLILQLRARLKISFKFSYERFKSLFGYGWKILVTSIISAIYNDIRPLIVGLKFSPTDLAFYSKGRSFPQLINSSVCGTVESVLFPVISKVQDDASYVLSITRRFIGVASYIVFPAMLGFSAISESFVSVFLTDKWLPAVPYIKIFCISFMFQIIQTGNLQTIRAIGRSDIILKLEVIKKSLFFVVLILFLIFSNSPIALAASGIITTLIASFCNSTPNRKLIGYKYRYQILDLLPNLVIALIMNIVVSLIGRLDLNIVAVMIIQILVGVLIYLFLSIVSKNKNFKYLLDFAKNLKRER